MGQRIYDWLRSHRAVLLALAIALAGGGTLAIVIDPDGDGPAPPRTVVTFAVNAAPGDGAPTRTLEAPATAVDAVAKSDVGEHAGSRDETPSGATPAQLDAAERVEERVRATLDPLPTAGASAGFAGCRTGFIGSYSSRIGVRPIWQVIHYTVSRNAPGWSDVLAIAAYFARWSTQASSHFIIDREGNCLYLVPIEQKAWTQGAGNSLGVSYEVIQLGCAETASAALCPETPFMLTPGYAKLRSVVHQVAQRTGIPLRRGSVGAGRSGIVEHADGGGAWGGHHDIRPFSIDDVVRIVTAPVTPPSPLTRVELRIVRGAARPASSGHSRRYWCDRNANQRTTIRRLARRLDGGWNENDRDERYQLLGGSFRARCT